MRLLVFLVLLSLTLAAAAGLAYRASGEAALSDRDAAAQISELPARFTRSHLPDFELSLAALPQWSSDPVLVDKAGAYVESRQYCHEDQAGTEPSPGKDAVWHEHAVCNALEVLPDGFFHRPPYLHLSGHSYAQLALAAEPEVFGKAAWLTENKAYFQVGELEALVRLGVELSPIERVVAELDDDGRRALAHGTELLLSREHVLVSSSSGTTPATAVYGVYRLAAWRRFLEGTPWRAAAHRDDEPCAAVLGSVCFGADPQGVRRHLDHAAALGASSLATLTLALAWVAIRRARAKRREQEARLFMLQTLSHEIRTPTTSLVLSLEPLRRHFDELPDAVQPAFLRICDNVQRLQRMVAATRQYLDGQLDGHPIQLQQTALASIDAFVRQILDGYEERIELVGIGAPAAACLDVYWVTTCIRNLVDNAIRHGALPIVVRLQVQAASLALTVEDQGPGSELSLEQMTAPFGRKAGSDGLGLGLAVIKRLVGAMGGRLRYEPRPTRFTIVLPGVMAR
ncbi:MAG: DUF3404 domain-containing protein [Deltaproteobacteria bacterium]|nr:DUF3404 domain-containing protein [Deltaproteobacteria bacterium]